MSAKNLNERQYAMLKYCRAYHAQHGIVPSNREIREACGISSVSVVHGNMKVLEAGGFIIRYPNISRGYVLTDKKVSGHYNGHSDVRGKGKRKGKRVVDPSQDGER